jgi:hypothetical protein
MRIRRNRKATSDPVAPAVRYGVTRAGSVGVGVYLNGKLAGWGLNETAAWASFQASKVAA